MRLLGRKAKKTFICIVLAITVAMSGMMAYHTDVHADTVITATVTGNSVNFREGAGTEYASLGKYNEGTTGVYLGEATASTGAKWYKLTINGITGYMHSEYVRLTSSESSDSDFEAYLTAQGFPESYKAALRILHEKYPNWVFKAQHTNLDWNKVLEAESKLGVNLVSGTSISSWKSTQDGAYDWTTSTWYTGFDSGNWVAASEEIIAYHLDPRNFLDPTNVFQFLLQSYDAASMTTAGLTAMVKDTFLEGTCPGTSSSYVSVYMGAASTYDVSPYYLAASTIQEMGTSGNSASISGNHSTYPGIYNYYNIGAFKTETMSAITRGLWWANGAGNGYTSYGRPWTTPEKAIYGGANYYADGYINVGQDTIYLKKFDLVGTLYTHQYMTNIQAAYSEARKLSTAYTDDLRSTALVFKIPVFLNMPSTPCAKPTGTGSPNYMLKSLSINGYSLTPTFSMYETSYSLIVPNNVSSINVSATAYDSSAKISGTGSHSLSVGTNAIKVTVTAGNGTTRTYTINVVRNSAGSSQTAPTVSSSTYKISGNTLTGLTTVPTTSSTLLSKISVSNGSAAIYTASGSTNSGNVGTGNILRIYNSSASADYTIIVYGDTSADGTINALDLLQVQRHILGLSSLSGAKATAADPSKDGSINALDLLLVQRHILGLKNIQQ